MTQSFTVPGYLKVFEELHDEQLDHFWRPPGSDRFSRDRAQWTSLPYGVRRRLKGVVNVLTRMEPEVIDNADDIQSLLKKVVPSDDFSIVHIMTDSFKSMEGIHIRSYGMIDSILSLDIPDEDLKMFESFIQMKIDAVSRWRSEGREDLPYQLARAIMGNILTEGLVFNTLFSTFSILKKDSILETTCDINSEVQFDENIHTRGFITMMQVFVTLGHIPRLPESVVHDMVNEMIDIDDKCADWLLGNMNKDESEFFLIMTRENAMTYTRIVANGILQTLGYTPLFTLKETGRILDKESNPYPFINQSLISNLGFFFDKHIVDYGLNVDYPYESDSDISDEE